jgi:methylthioribose-1-phosphate isomerase
VIAFPFPVAEWTGDAVKLIDQTRLPGELTFRHCRTIDQLDEAIRVLAVRGAPAIGVAAAYGLVLSWHLGLAAGEALPALRERLDRDQRQLAATRPTAVNLFWALRRMRAAADAVLVEGASAADVAAKLLAEAQAIHQEDVAMGRALGRAGQALLPRAGAVLTHCNAGGLATGGYGTALGVIYAAWEAGKRIQVYADETRPLLQGARLTAWELRSQGIPVTVLPDTAAATLLRQGRVDAVITGADRIAANGDAANKIGTYPLAVLARRHGVPFYVAAPSSTVDPATARGELIEIEQRDPAEVHGWGAQRLTPEGVDAFNPAFDVTPAGLISAIITEQGVLRPPYAESLFLDTTGGEC